MLLAVQPPVGRQAERRGGGFAFRVDPGVGRQPAALFQQLAGRHQQVLVERRIEEHQVIRLRRLLGQVAQRIGLLHLAVAALQGLQVAAQGGHRGGVQVQRQGLTGATRQGFEKQRAAAGERVEDPGARHIGGNPVEQGFAHPVRGRAQAGAVGEAETTAAPVTGDDAQLARAAMCLGRGGVRSAHQCGTPAGCGWAEPVGGGSSLCGTVGPTVTTTKRSGSRWRFMAALTCSALSPCTSSTKRSR